MPAVSSMNRVRWTHMLRGSHRLPTALAMESVVDEFVFIVGPVLVTFLSTTGHATSGVVTAFTLAAIAGLAVGSMASGIGWGTVHWRRPLRHRLAAVLVIMTLCSVPLLLVQDVWVMVPFVVLAGVAVSPSLISSFTLAEVLVPRAAVTEAFTWIGTALGLGVAVGSSVAGKIVDVFGANTAFSVATVAAAVAAVTVGAFRRHLRVPAER